MGGRVQYTFILDGGEYKAKSMYSYRSPNSDDPAYYEVDYIMGYKAEGAYSAGPESGDSPTLTLASKTLFWEDDHYWDDLFGSYHGNLKS